MDENEYLMRPRDEDELSRLSLQHRVWKRETDGILHAAGFGEGDRVLDIGSGPGYLSFDLADLVGPTGSVLAVDSSERFVEQLLHEAEQRELRWVKAEVADARSFPGPDAAFDGAVCRWVLMFLGDPETVIERAARAMRPGGVFTVMEYMSFRSISLWPRGEQFRKLYDSVYELILKSGGDPDVGYRVPELLSAAGFELMELIPILRVGRPGTPLWDWLDANNLNHSNLVEEALLEPFDLEAYLEEWSEHACMPTAFFTAPPVLATIARRR